MPRSITLSGGALANFTRTREELMRRANDVIAGIRAGWLKLNIGEVLPMERAIEAHQLLESRQTQGKLILMVETRQAPERGDGRNRP